MVLLPNPNLHRGSSTLSFSFLFVIYHTFPFPAYMQTLGPVETKIRNSNQGEKGVNHVKIRFLLHT